MPCLQVELSNDKVDRLRKMDADEFGNYISEAQRIKAMRLADREAQQSFERQLGVNKAGSDQKSRLDRDEQEAYQQELARVNQLREEDREAERMRQRKLIASGDRESVLLGNRQLVSL